MGEPYEKHVFVCTNVKAEGKRSCGPSGGVEICERLKALSKTDPEVSQRNIRVNKSGCLGPCEEGPNLVIYPEGTWLHGVKLEDVPVILERLKNQAANKP